MSPERAGISLEGKTVLVTGASGGIGGAIVRRIAALGGMPVIHYARNAAAAEALLSEIGGAGTPVQADLSVPEGATALWQEAVARCGRIHALVNNAGVRGLARVGDDLALWQSAWDSDLRVNLLAPADLCRLAIRHFRDAGGGRIVNIASRAGQRGYTEDHMPYGASKAGLINLTKSIARNFGKDGVTAVAIAPGFVRTEMAESFVAAHGRAAAVGDIPTGEMVTPEELADLVAFTLRDAQVSLNGATLDVNGGSYLR
ncbi:SDR family oxidoreductase [Salipiger sp. P9]|uniref:SDR family NAD(P)-dependent oxidoreductase n=1 Tax=Salipiger pentaromativorans TaxID=2943193 RepID=UPI002157E684|nr:SDR family oxidoreductase [Salipiger pentaromativorans]MCR8546420.1 SDR family oxidoreductase [Salipiger pentaromativorans]